MIGDGTISGRSLEMAGQHAITVVWYSSVERTTRHIIGHLGDDFTGHMTQPTVSQH